MGIETIKNIEILDNYIKSGLWDNAISFAQSFFPNEDVWGHIAANYSNEMPDEVVEKIIDIIWTSRLNVLDSKFIPELLKNHHGKFGPKLARKIVKILNDVYLPHDSIDHLSDHLDNDAKSFIQKITKRPSYIESLEERRNKAVLHFWTSFDYKPDARHYALVKSAFTGVPETFYYKGNEGKSYGWYILNGKEIHDNSELPQIKVLTRVYNFYDGNYYTKAESVLAYLKDYATDVQNKIKTDPNTVFYKTKESSKNFEKNSIKLYHIVDGVYAEIIKKELLDKKNKTISIPVPPFSVWYPDIDSAKKALAQKDSKKAFIIKGAFDLTDILHSGCHSVVHGITIGEKKFIVGHPKGYIVLNSNNIYNEFSDLNLDNSLTMSYSETEDMQKSLKTQALGLGMAAAMLGVPKKISEHLTSASSQSSISKIISKKTDVINPLPPLKAIAMIESSGGKNIEHKPVNTPMHQGTAAIGRFGMMPVLIKDIVTKNKHLNVKYPHIAQLHPINDYEKLKEYILSNPSVEAHLANTHWINLHNKFNGDEDRMAYAWFNGISKAKKATDEEVKNHFYVKRYNKYKKLLDLEQPNLSFNKTEPKEDKLPSDVENIKEFVPISVEENNDLNAIKEINNFISNKQIMPVPNMGHFSHESFVLGLDDNNSWFMKVEQGNRPAILSAKHGFQTVKEFLFYKLAKEVFNLDEYVPKVILGELIYENNKKLASAIKMIGEGAELAADKEDENPGAVFNILEKYRKEGVLHKMAAMLFILGDGDSHGRNVMVKNDKIYLIDHGSAFADYNFDPSTDENIFIPYILRLGRIKDSMSDEQKIEKMPYIDCPEVKKAVETWLFSIDKNKMINILNNFDINPGPFVERLKKLQNRVLAGGSIDQIINEAWVKPL